MPLLRRPLTHGSPQLLQDRLGHLSRRTGRLRQEDRQADSPAGAGARNRTRRRTVASRRVRRVRRGVRHPGAHHGGRSHGRAQRRTVSRAHRRDQEDRGQSARPDLRRPPLRARPGVRPIALSPRPAARPHAAHRRARPGAVRGRLLGGGHRPGSGNDRQGARRRSRPDRFPHRAAGGHAVARDPTIHAGARCARRRWSARLPITPSNAKPRRWSSAGRACRFTIWLARSMRWASARISWAAGLRRSTTRGNSALSARAAATSAASWCRPSRVSRSRRPPPTAGCRCGPARSRSFWPRSDACCSMPGWRGIARRFRRRSPPHFKRPMPPRCSRRAGSKRSASAQIVQELGESEAPLVLAGASVVHTNSLDAIAASHYINLMLGVAGKPGGILAPGADAAPPDRPRSGGSAGAARGWCSSTARTRSTLCRVPPVWRTPWRAPNW